MDDVQSHPWRHLRRERSMQWFIVAVRPAFLTLLAGAYKAIDIAISAIPTVAELCFLVGSISPPLTRFFVQLPQDFPLFLLIPQDPPWWHSGLRAPIQHPISRKKPHREPLKPLKLPIRPTPGLRIVTRFSPTLCRFSSPSYIALLKEKQNPTASP